MSSNKKKENGNHSNHLVLPKDYYTLDTDRGLSSIETPLSNENRNYPLFTFLNSKRQPDIYYGNTFLSGMNYVNKKPIQDEEINQTDQDNMEEDINHDNNDISDYHEGKYQDLKNTNMRYFNFSQNITIKCFNCGKIGHMSRSCPHDQIIVCLRCNRIGHDDRVCPITKCFKCNQYGHRSHNCPLTKKDLIMCERCDHIGHKGYDCLIEPMKINSHMFKYNDLTCYFCGSNKHVLCPFDIRRPPVSLVSSLYYQSKVKSNKQKVPNESSSEEGEIDGEEERIFKSFTNGEIPSHHFCPRCGGKHKVRHCRESDKKNEFDERRLQFSNYIFAKKSYK